MSAHVEWWSKVQNYISAKTIFFYSKCRSIRKKNTETKQKFRIRVERKKRKTKIGHSKTNTISKKWWGADKKKKSLNCVIRTGIFWKTIPNYWFLRNNCDSAIDFVSFHFGIRLLCFFLFLVTRLLGIYYCFMNKTATFSL